MEQGKAVGPQTEGGGLSPGIRSLLALDLFSWRMMGLYALGIVAGVGSSWVSTGGYGIQDFGEMVFSMAMLVVILCAFDEGRDAGREGARQGLWAKGLGGGMILTLGAMAYTVGAGQDGSNEMLREAMGPPMATLAAGTMGLAAYYLGRRIGRKLGPREVE